MILINIHYGQAVNVRGSNEQLLLDIYQPPLGDAMAQDCAIKDMAA